MDVDDARADDAAYDGEYGYRVDVVGVYAARRRPPPHQIHSRRYCDEAEEAVPAKYERRKRGQIGSSSDFNHM